MIHLKEILQSRKTHAKIETGNTIEYENKSKQVKNTQTATSFSFPEINNHKLINQSLHIVDLNIDHYDRIIGRDLIRSLGVDIHGTDMTIHWDDAAIPWRDIYSTKNYVFSLLQYNAPLKQGE